MHETRVNTKWSVKIVIFFAALAGLGFWGLYDALIKYPAMGLAAAEWAEREYLAAAVESGDLLRASVENPQEALRDLYAQEDQIRQAAGQASGVSARQAITRLKRLEWLESLAIIGKLNEDNTTFENPSERLDELRAAQANQNQPKPLAAYDIPMQWVFVAAGFGGAAWLAYLFVSVKRRTFRYDSETLALTLPEGKTISPADIAEVDKRKWDKFLVTLRLKDGAAHRLDLLRYTPLEEWVLEMEKRTDGYEPPEEPQHASDDAADEAENEAAERV